MSDLLSQLKRCVQEIEPNAYSAKLADGSGYIVWPGKCQPRGFEKCAIGFGETEEKAWGEALLALNIWTQKDRKALAKEAK